MANVLITGATGTIGTELTKHLKETHDLTLVDVDFSGFSEELKEGTEQVKRDLEDPENWENLLDGIEYVIHLAGVPNQDAEFYDDVLDQNFKLPYNLYNEAADAQDLKRIIFASSVHAVDAYPDNVQVEVSDPIRPTGMYGVSKVFLEALGSYYAYNENIQSIGIRIADYKADNSELDEAADENGMSMFFSAQDMNHLVDRCLAVEMEEPYLLVNGISNNTFPRLTLEEAQRELDYQPKDNAFKMNGYFE